MSDVTIPEGIREQARWVYDSLGHGSTADEDTIARAMAVAVKTEQERCAKIADLAAERSYWKSADENIRGHNVRGVYVGSFLSWTHDAAADAATSIAQAIRSSHE